MNKPLSKKVALITGASRGIGKAIALRFANMGATIAVNYVRNEEAAKQTASEIKAIGANVEIFQANVGNAKDAATMIEAVLEKFGGVDIFIHSAAMGAFKPVHKLRANQWDISMDINAKAFLFMVQKVLPSMEKAGHGTIIGLSSLGGQQYIPNYGAIGISKAALEATIRYLAVELGPKGIRVNGVSGGLVNTDALKYFPDYEKFEKEVKAKTPAGRIADPDDLAKVVAFLVSPEAEWITGQTLIADGGLSLI